MVVHVYENVKKSEYVNDVIVAVDDEETVKELKKWKVKTMMSDINHTSGTDRVHEIAKTINADIVVNVQADEPYMNHELIDLLVEEFVNEDIEIVTAAGKTLNAKQLNDYNTVKVMVDRDKFATAFRRAN